MDVQNFWDFNIGHVITIGTGIISLVVAWQKVCDKIESMSQRVDKQEQKTDQLTELGLLTLVNQHERRIGTLETVASDIGSMKTDISWIKSSLEERKEE